MPSRLGKRKDYDLVDDGHDSRVPLHNEEAFRHGINFKAKYIGTLDVPRPTGRMEIVVAMRRIRYEFKAKAIKKRKVNIRVSTDGVKIILRKKKKKKEWAWDLERMLIMHDPIYRIFYVSHDSHDLKIWSFIARDGSSNVFRCNVFKSPKKSQAMRVVRTVGQAFEVCHKLNIGPPIKNDEGANDKIKEIASNSDKTTDETDGSKDDKTNNTTTDNTNSSSKNGEIDAKVSLSSDGKSPILTVDAPTFQSTSEPIPIIQSIDTKTPLSTHHQLQLSQKKIQQAEHQAEVAVAQVQLLKDQLAVETTARIEAQARNHQLMVENHELLQQMTELVSSLTEVESKLSNVTIDQSYSLNLSRIMVDATTPASGSVNMPLSTDITKVSPLMDTSLFANANTSSMPTPDLSKHSSGQLATTDTSTSTITKSSNTSGSVRTKYSRKMGNIIDGDDSGSSSDSSSDDDGIDRPVHMASESSTLKNLGMDKTNASLVNGSAIVNQTGETSIWTSGLITPERILSGQGYQQSNMSFNDISMNTTVNDSNISNGYTLSPIFNMGGNNDSQSSFQHFSITDADTSLRIDDTPKTVENSLKKSFSTSADMHEKQGKSILLTSHSNGDLGSPSKSNKNIIKWTKVTEKESMMDMEDSFSAILPESSSIKSPDAILTPRLEPPPKVKRVQSARTPPENHRPRPETQLPGGAAYPPSATIGNLTTPKLVDTSDSDMEIPPKLAKYHNQGVKLSQSAFGYGSDPLLSRFDPLLSKSKSFDHNSPSFAPKPTSEPTSTVLSPVQDVGQSNPFLYITPNTPESSKYPVDPVDLSKSYSELDQSSMYVSGVFMSPNEYEAKLRYEPLRKQQASEWHRTNDTVRLNSSFHAGDQKEESLSKISSQSDSSGPLQVYRTYSDLPSTLTPVKKVPLPTTPEKTAVEEIMTQTLGSYNSNNNNNITSSFKEPPSVDGNISLLDDLFISESEDKSLEGDLTTAKETTKITCKVPKNVGPETSIKKTLHNFSEDLNISSGIISSSILIDHSGSVELMKKCNEAVMSTLTNENNPVSVGSNSDSGVSGCGGFKLERDSANSPTIYSDDH